MKEYLNIVDYVLKNGERKENRTGTATYSVSGVKFEHDMKDGFPLITTKKVPYRLIASELEFFIKGLTDKKWLQDRNNHIWDEWCSPEIVPYGHDEETKQRMKEERDLGPIYGWQWRHFGAKYGEFDENPIMHIIKKGGSIIKNLRFPKNYEIDYSGRGIDQLEDIVNKLKTNPNDRRMIVTAWNPQDISKMALPPCHYQFQVTVTNNKLNLMWNQRSVDVMLGLPFNIASYATLLHLLAKETGLEEGKLTGFLGDTHIYEDHIEGAKEQLSRQPYDLSQLITKKFTSIFDWEYKNSKIVNYKKHPQIKFDIAV